MTGRVVDGRGLVHPEPLQRVMAALPDLPRGEALTLLLHREPFPLYRLLHQLQFTWRTALADDGTYTIEIRHGP